MKVIESTQKLTGSKYVVVLVKAFLIKVVKAMLMPSEDKLIAKKELSSFSEFIFVGRAL